MEMRQVDPEEQGVGIALEKICSLESRLRLAIQNTRTISVHNVNMSLSRDLGAIDKEREALLLIRENLELLEDKLREFRTMAMDPKGYDDKAVALSQLDSLRKDLLRGAKDRVDYVQYNKDVVKDIIAFSDTGSGDESLPDLPSEPEGYTNGFSRAESACSSDDDESCYENGYGDHFDHRSYVTSSRGASPYTSKEPLSLLMPDKEDIHLHPAPAVTPSIRASSTQSTRDYHGPVPDIGANSIPNMRTSSVDNFQQSRNIRPDSHIHMNGHTQSSRRSSTRQLSYKETRPYEDVENENVRANIPRHPQFRDKQAHDSEIMPDTIQPRAEKRAQKPASCAGSNMTPRLDELSENLHYSNTRQQPYGGSLSFGRKENSELSAPIVPLPPTPVPADRPRVVSTSSFSSDEQIRPVKVKPASNLLKTENESESPANSESHIQPSRHSNLSTRNNRLNEPPKQKRGGVGQLLNRQAQKVLGKTLALKTVCKKGFQIAIGLAAMGTVFQAVANSGIRLQLPLLHSKKKRRQRRVPSLEDLWKFPNLPSIHNRHSVDQPGKPRSDGSLVPEWMHNTKFSATEYPPVGSLTPSTQPPVGEMFPVIPPHTSNHVKG